MEYKSLLAILVLFVAFSVTTALIPKIIRLAIRLRKFDNLKKGSREKRRKVHIKPVPRFGGVAIYLSFILSSIVISRVVYDEGLFSYFLHFISLITFMFAIGVLDDITELKARFKFWLQIVICTVMVVTAESEPLSLHGFGGIYEISITATYILSICIVLFFVNAFNFIDGIDTMAASFAIYAFVVLGGIFLLNSLWLDFMISLVFLGAFSGFYVFNFSPAKIFLGDGGTLMVGLVLGYLGLKASQLDLDADGTANIMVVLSIAIYPITDTFQVIITRLLRRKHPFHADRRHIHHIMIALGLSHVRSSVYMLIFSASVFGLIYILRDYPTLCGILLIAISIISTVIIKLVLRVKSKKQQ